MSRPVRNELLFGPLAGEAVHLCVDMQELFRQDTPWKTPWMSRIAPVVTRIARAHPRWNVFTRFIPADRSEAGVGAWKRYWRCWQALTLQQLDPRLLSLLPELSALCPPGQVFDKAAYSPWMDGRLHRQLQNTGCTTVIVTGGETDVCVLATVIGAVDLGYRTLVVHDALCSSSDETHDAVMAIYSQRYSQQIEVVTAELVLDEWRPA